MSGIISIVVRSSSESRQGSNIGCVSVSRLTPKWSLSPSGILSLERAGDLFLDVVVCVCVCVCVCVVYAYIVPACVCGVCVKCMCACVPSINCCDTDSSRTLFGPVPHGAKERPIPFSFSSSCASRGTRSCRRGSAAATNKIPRVGGLLVLFFTGQTFSWILSYRHRIWTIAKRNHVRCRPELE